jgi:hypothetical protein
LAKWKDGGYPLESLVVAREAVRRDMRVLKWWRAGDVDDVWIISIYACLSF